jgi:hypothetical protein
MMDTFLDQVGARYMDANRRALTWMLDRPRLRDGLVNTKLNPLTLRDYGPDDAMRGPDYVYGWIQGRALEALVTHAAAFAPTDPEFARALEACARPIYHWLGARLALDGHIAFCYGPDDTPVFPNAEGEPQPQSREPDIFTYSDAFAAKGLVAAAHHFGLPEREAHLGYLREVIHAAEVGRFQIDEKRHLSHAAIAEQPHDFGPRMILLGAAALLRRLGLDDDARFAGRMITHILVHHLDPATGLLRNSPGSAQTNPGHAIEMVGFALDALGTEAHPATQAALVRILRQSYAAGRCGPGIAIVADVDTELPDPALLPWWTLPETIRAAALAYSLTGDADLLDIWQDADTAFFTDYWRDEPPIAYQSRNMDGPVDAVPATPDLDPGYHTGLSLLAAIRAVSV